MSLLQEPTPFDQPFAGALVILKRELFKRFMDFFNAFDHEGKSKTAMSTLLRFHEANLMDRAKEIGGTVLLNTTALLEACSNFANGQGQLEDIYFKYKKLQKDLAR